MKLEERLKRREILKAEGFPATLSEMFERTGLTLDHCAHICVDNQMKYMDSSAMEEASDRINDHIAPSFNQLGIRTYWIVWPVNEGTIPVEVGQLAAGDFKDGGSLIRDRWPADIDKVIPKNRTSAFERWPYANESGPTLTERILEDDQVGVLFVTGFFADACLKKTAEDACQKGYCVVWLEDGSHLQDFHEERQMQMREQLRGQGVIFMRSEDAMADIRQRALHNPMIPV